MTHPVVWARELQVLNVGGVPIKQSFSSFSEKCKSWIVLGTDAWMCFIHMDSLSETTILPLERISLILSAWFVCWIHKDSQIVDFPNAHPIRSSAFGELLDLSLEKFQIESCKAKTNRYCWWFRHPVNHHLECNKKPVVNNGINYQPQLISSINTKNFQGLLPYPKNLLQVSPDEWPPQEAQGNLILNR